MLGVALALVGSVTLCVVTPGDRLPALAVYAATLVLTIAASAAYNLWPVSRFKWLLRRIDHSAIYLLIAGTYTPFMALLGCWRTLAAIWFVAVTGVALKIALPGRFDRLSIALYLALGWSGLLLLPSLIATLSATALWLIAIGGVIYSVGVLFHVWERLRFQNAIWHGFVLAGASVHYAAVWSAAASLA